jgi:hypothetical protein
MGLFGMEGITIDDNHNLIYQGESIITLEELHDYCEKNEKIPGDVVKLLCGKIAMRDKKIKSVLA